MDMDCDSSSTTCTTCPYCGVGCGVEVSQTATTTQVRGDKSHPANFGKLCSKGYALVDTLGYENRLIGPRVNNREASWSEALATISEEFKAVRDTHGPEAIGFYVSGQLLTEDYYVVNKLVKGYLGTANIDTNSRLCMASSVAGHKRAFGSDTVPGCYEDLELADLLVLVGSNLAWCHPVLFRRIEEARKLNPKFKLVVIDPRKTATAEMADLHLPIIPGGENDAALFVGLFNYLVNSNAVNHGWVIEHTQSFDDAFQASLAWSPNRVVERTGLRLDTVLKFYRLFRNTKKVVTVFSQGVNQSEYGTDTVNSIINVHLATGRIGKPGCGPFSITGQPNAMGGREVGGLSNMLASHMDIENPAHRDLVQRFWGSPTMAKKPGLKAVDLFKAVGSGKIKALWIMATNPVDSMPSADKVARAIADCPFVVVSDVCANTDTANLASVNLPALAWSEKDGTVTNSERRISRQRSFRSAPGDAKPDWWAVCEVAKRLGYQSGFDYKGANEIFAEHAALSGFENYGYRDFDISAYSDISAADYDALLPFQWPAAITTDNRENSRAHRFFSDGKFFTNNGKARFVSIKLPAAAALNQTLITAGTYPHALRKEIIALLNTGRIRDQWHTMTRTGYIAKLCSHQGEPFVEINPDDALVLGIREASLVNLSARLGHVTVRALLSDRVKPGTAFMPMHWTNEFSSNARVNRLFNSTKDPISGQPALKNQQVKISACPMASYGVMISRKKPTNLGFLNYWALSAVEHGWKIEFASKKDPQNLMSIIKARSDISLDGFDMIESDDCKGRYFNACWFKGGRVLQAVYIGPEPVVAPRELLPTFLEGCYSSSSERLRVLSASGCKDQPNQGPIVCSCMGVGCYIIEASIHKGARNVDAVGEACGAGTQCGSCQPEIKILLNHAKLASNRGEHIGSQQALPAL